MTIKLRAFGNYDVDKASFQAGLACLDPSLAQQHQAEEADINTIVRRFGLTGQLPVVDVPPMYGDFEGVDDYRSALHLVMEAQRSFGAMPAEVRSRFQNDPALFVDFCSDPRNLEEMRTLGLAVPKPQAEPSEKPGKGE